MQFGQDDPETRKRKLQAVKAASQKRRRIQLSENQTKTTFIPLTTNQTSNEPDIVQKSDTDGVFLEKEFGPDDEIVEALSSDLFSTTNLAMQKLRGMFPSQLRQLRFEENNFKFFIPPVIVRHMLYAMVEDRTEVDRQIDEYLQENRIRQFQLITLGRDAIGYVFTQDYLDTAKKILAAHREKEEKIKQAEEKDLDERTKRLRQQRRESESKSGNTIDNVKTTLELEQIIVDRFEKDLLPNYRDPFISKEQVKTALGCQDKHLNILMKIGLFTIRDANSFWFGIPNVGVFLDFLVKGREELVSWLKRKKYKEMMLHTMESSVMKKSPLGNLFHVRDLLGSGGAECIMTSNGAMIALRNKK
jgi:serine/threonine-protein kinase 19